MSELQRNALARDITMRLMRGSLDDLCIVDRLVLRLEQLRALSWTRHAGSVDRKWHLVGISNGSMLTRCNGRWPFSDPVETSFDGPPLQLMCAACAERWARGKDLELYGLLDLARDLATEDLSRALLHEQARAEMIGGGR